jgi:hypothetical protein
MPPSIHLAMAQRGLVVRSDSGDMGQRLVALLREHPEGLPPTAIRTLLGVDTSLADTGLGMLRSGLVQRVGPGRYGAVAPSRNDR